MSHPQQSPSEPQWSQDPQPGFGAPPPMPPAPQKKGGSKVAGFGCLGAVALLIIAVAIGSNSDKEQDKASKHTSSSDTGAHVDSKPADDATPSLSQRTLTELSVGVAWEGFSESRKSVMCSGVDLYGKDWAAEQMEAGSRANSDSADLDWDYAAEIVEDKCAAR
ncbi:hypothetical protein AB8A21_34400 [Streptomyces sp. BF23-18]|uniref:hypothetical protein n=1 Tax=Streptomyces sp. BF23-18 TaxID=3240282 RepID=UPI0034E44CD8